APPRTQADAHLPFVACEARLHVPAGVTGVLGAGEAQREGAEARRRLPPAGADELVVGLLERLGAGGGHEGWGGHRGDAYHRSGPGRRVVRLAPTRAPQLVAAGERSLLRHG